MTALKDAMSKLETVAATLNEESDGINAVIEETEAQLAGIGVGLSVWLFVNGEHRLEILPVEELESEEPVGTRHCVRYWVLGYARLGQWQLAVRQALRPVDDTRYEPEPEPYWVSDPLPLINAPRAVRVEALPLLEDLVVALAEKAKGQVHTIREAKETLLTSARWIDTSDADTHEEHWELEGTGILIVESASDRGGYCLTNPASKEPHDDGISFSNLTAAKKHGELIAKEWVEAELRDGVKGWTLVDDAVKFGTCLDDNGRYPLAVFDRHGDMYLLQVDGIIGGSYESLEDVMQGALSRVADDLLHLRGPRHAV